MFDWLLVDAGCCVLLMPGVVFLLIEADCSLHVDHSGANDMQNTDVKFL